MSSFHASQQKVEARWASDLRAMVPANSLDTTAACRPGTSCPSVEILSADGGLIAFRVGVASS
jgi:hypothetical protein